MFARRGIGTVGAPHLSACGGKFYWELRVITATGIAGGGFAGTSFRCDRQAPKNALLGEDEASWALYADDGKRYHRWPYPHISASRYS
jgi:hypothetical protein